MSVAGGGPGDVLARLMLAQDCPSLLVLLTPTLSAGWTLFSPRDSQRWYCSYLGPDHPWLLGAALCSGGWKAAPPTSARSMPGAPVEGTVPPKKMSTSSPQACECAHGSPGPCGRDDRVAARSTRGPTEEAEAQRGRGTGQMEAALLAWKLEEGAMR